MNSQELEPLATLSKTLKNGLKIYLVAADCNMFHIELKMKVGMYSEGKGEYEFAHFLEHLNAQFTSKEHPLQQEVISKIESFGVEWNAFTTARHTGYFVKGFAEENSRAQERSPFIETLNVMRESYFNFEIDDSIFLQEVHAVMQELGGYAGSSEAIMEETHNSMMYPGHPLTITINERLQNMRTQSMDTLSFKRKILNFRKKYYGPHNTVLTVAVPVYPENATMTLKSFYRQFIKTHWDRDWQGEKILNASDTVLFNPARPLKKTPGEDTLIRICQVDSAPGVRSTILISLRIYDLTLQDYKLKLAIRFLCHRLTGGFDSLLMKKLRTEEGLIYSIHAYGEYDLVDPNLSSLNIQTSCDPENAVKAQRLIIEQLQEMNKHRERITQSDLDTFKKSEHYALEGLTVNKDPSKWIDSYSTHVLFGKPVRTFTQIKETLDDLSLGHVRGALDLILKRGEMYITFNAPKEKQKVAPNMELTEMYERFLKALAAQQQQNKK